MPGSLSYAQLITPRDVALAIEQFIIAPYGTSWVASSGRINMASIPSGFSYLGRVVPDSPQVTISKDIFQLDYGLPRTRQYQQVVGVGARIQFSLHSRDTRHVAYALGNLNNDAILYVLPNSATLISSVMSAALITLSGSPANPWYVGDEIMTAATSAAIGASQNATVISSINGLQITVDPPFASLPVVTPGVAIKPLAQRTAFSTSILRSYRLIGVADFTDGVQIVHDFQKVQPAGEFVDIIRNTENPKIPLSFEAFGLVDSNYGNELNVGERFYFQKAS